MTCCPHENFKHKYCRYLSTFGSKIKEEDYVRGEKTKYVGQPQTKQKGKVTTTTVRTTTRTTVRSADVASHLFGAIFSMDS